ncbi:TRAP transporter substrate-binding protein [Motiliproteus sp. SC1-56]|uniref:TRAP transporter substrate-binding protein n=1 Tax=Motiliproteus sp. SC1-56 TaxID=2799565 RepID=UPI001F5C8099|nr:TRAP transporter substrate-binding protein [Motiliproteus sp. SC1-56]
MTTRIKTTMLRVTAAAALCLGATTALAAEFTLKVHHFLPPQSAAHSQFIKPWADKVEAESEGRIEVQIYPAMQLGGKPPQLFDQVRSGVADIVWTLPGYTRGRFPITAVFELPFIAGNAEATSQAAWDFYQEYLREEYADVHPLLLHAHAGGTLHTVDRPVKKLEDLKGMKIRTPTQSATELLELVGAVPVGMPVPSVPQALSKKVVDGAMLPYEVTMPLKVHELVGYHTEMSGDRQVNTSVFLFAMNNKTYEQLPDDLKQVIDRNSGANIAREVGALWDRADQPGRQAASKRGNEITVLPPEEVERWREATLPVREHWIAQMEERGLPGRQMLEDADRLVKQYTR